MSMRKDDRPAGASFFVALAQGLARVRQGSRGPSARGQRREHLTDGEPASEAAGYRVKLLG
mgnify:CR=1 FL=1